MRLWITWLSRSLRSLGSLMSTDPKVGRNQVLFGKQPEFLIGKRTRVGHHGRDSWELSSGHLEVAEKIAMTNFELKTSLMYPFSEFGSNWKEDKKIKLKELEEDRDFSAKVSSKALRIAAAAEKLSTIHA